MKFTITTALLLTAFVGLAAAKACEVTSQSYAANDGLVLVDAAYVVTFTAKCPENVTPVYANLDGRGLTVVKSEDGQYQISWTSEMSKARSSSFEIGFYDENSAQLLKKAQSSGGSEPSALFTISYSHSSPYRGPMVQSEAAAVAIGLFLCYHALALRFKIAKKQI